MTVKEIRKVIMEKTYKRVPFDIELAKKIQAGEIEGKLLFFYADEYKQARIICWDRKPTYPIVALVKIGPVYESVFFFSLNGKTGDYGELFIELPEETPKHEFKPFDRVLVRDFDGDPWCAELYSHSAGNGDHYCIRKRHHQVIPYEGNEHLIGTTDKPE